MPYEEIQCYYSVRCFCMLPPSFNPLAFNYLDYVQRKKRIVGEQLSEMRPQLKCVPEVGGGGGQPGEVFSIYSLNAIVRNSPLRAGIGPALEYRYEPGCK